jgi:hypothetical protein
MLCKYNNVFGKPGTGFHSIRIFNVAILDVIGTIAIAYIIARYMNWNTYITIICAFVIGIIFHRIFCVNTTINKMIFGKVEETFNQCIPRSKNKTGNNGNNATIWDGNTTPTRDQCNMLSKNVERTKAGILKVHNCYRRIHGLSDMRWNDEAAQDANNSPLYCRQDICGYTQTCHDNDNKWWQNIGWAGPVSISQFYDEIKYCPNRDRPQDCNWNKSTGHLVTMMTRRSVGCAFKSQKEGCDELRCNYD